MHSNADLDCPSFPTMWNKRRCRGSIQHWEHWSALDRHPGRLQLHHALGRHLAQPLYVARKALISNQAVVFLSDGVASLQQGRAQAMGTVRCAGYSPDQAGLLAMMHAFTNWRWYQERAECNDWSERPGAKYCNWDGVTCNAAGQVTEVIFLKNGSYLTGDITPHRNAVRVRP